MNNPLEITLNSHTYYTEIKKVALTERKVLNVEKKYKKGDLIKTKMRLFGKSIPQYAETDLYESCYYDYDGHTHKSLLKAETYAKNRGIHYDAMKDEFYKQAIVEITFRNDKSETHKFDETSDAVNFLETIKEKCSQCGNKLL